MAWTFGVTKDYNVPETNISMNSTSFYKEKFKLGLVFGICMWIEPTVK